MRLPPGPHPTIPLMNPGLRNKLFVMMILQFFIWGAWLPLIFGYLPAMGLSEREQQLIGRMRIDRTL